MVIARPTLITVVVAALSATACTAVVLENIGEYDDYPVGDPTRVPRDDSGTSSSSSGASSSSSGRPDPCSLLTSRRGANVQLPTNACAECIAAECSDEVAYACNEGKSKKDWFGDLADCAQNPWLEDPPPSSSGSFWGCGGYDKDVGNPIEGADDQHHLRESEICVKTKCVSPLGSPCKLCDPNIDVAGTGDNLLLSEDRCGKLFPEKCGQTLVDCCTLQPIDEFVRYCANTRDDANLTKCQGILQAKTDFETFKQERTSSGGNRYGDEDLECAKKLAQCFDANKGSYQCE